jgi:hypothetical protein
MHDSCIIKAARRATDRSETLARVMTELDWHLQLWIDAKDLPERASHVEFSRPAVVIDARTGLRTPGFQSLLRAVGKG